MVGGGIGRLGTGHALPVADMRRDLERGEGAADRISNWRSSATSRTSWAAAPRGRPCPYATFAACAVTQHSSGGADRNDRGVGAVGVDAAVVGEAAAGEDAVEEVCV